MAACATHHEPETSRATATAFTIGGELPIDTPTPATASQSRACAAWNGTSYLVTWLDARAGVANSLDLYATRLSGAGAPLGTGTLVASSVKQHGVASNGTDFLVVWSVAATLKAARVSGSTGALLDAVPLTLATEFFPGLNYSSNLDHPIGVAFDGTNYVVAWTDGRYGPVSGTDVFAARISPAGVLLDPAGVLVASDISDQYEAAIASRPGESLIVWSDSRNEYYEATDIYGARFSSAGSVLDPNGIAIVRSDGRQYDPSVAWNGTSWAVVFTDSRRTSVSDQDIYMARVSSSGTVTDTKGMRVVQAGAGGAFAPIVLASGNAANELVVWQEGGATPAIRGTWLGATGNVLDPSGLALVAETGNATFPTLAPGPSPGQSALFYARVRSDVGGQRIMARFVDPGAVPGTACAEAATCRTRQCRDGVCCEEPCDGPCRRCGTDGKCVAVAAAADPDTCKDGSRCDASGVCKKVEGTSCTSADDCASGFCADGFCCNASCDGACDTCAAQPGTCTLVAAGAPGSPSCSPFRCSGFVPACPERCGSDEDCAEGFGCDRRSGACVSGAVCTDDHTARTPDGLKTDCRPYACRDGACATACSSVTDCTFPAACNEDGRCVAPADLAAAGGCAMGRGPSGAGSTLAVALFAFIVSKRRRRA